MPENISQSTIHGNMQIMLVCLLKKYILKQLNALAIVIDLYYHMIYEIIS